MKGLKKKRKQDKIGLVDDAEFTEVEQGNKEGANGSIDIEGGSGSSGAAINSDSGMRFKINKNGECFLIDDLFCKIHKGCYVMSQTFARRDF